MKIECWMIGKTSEAYIKTGLDEYKKRLQKYIPLAWIEIADVKNGGKMTQPALIKAEGEKVLKLLKNNDLLICLDEKGKTYDSVQFSNKIEDWLQVSHGRIIFLIGGAYGHSADVKKRSHSTVGLSSMTFTHQMVRLILIEQIYRGFTIIKGQKYHH